MELLRLNTAGSVDDGKSTLIGRFLYDSGVLTYEQEELIKRKTYEKGLTDLDFSVITDGLIAEREQGITIDVAHIYFSSEKKKFIIADSPGHVEYTRNMVTGASNSDLSIILIDARKGLQEQSYRHYFISKLLKLDSVIFCVNKMDLVEYEEGVYWKIAAQIEKMIHDFEGNISGVSIVPISSLKGDNVVFRSDKMQWYSGSTLSELLHSFEKIEVTSEKFRMDIQQVYHVQNDEFVDYRSYAGKINSGKISLGDEVVVLPSLNTSKVVEIRKYKSLLECAKQGDSVQLRLEDDIDVSRGMLFVNCVSPDLFGKEIEVTLVWMDEKPLNVGGKYLLQVNSRESICKIVEIVYLINPEFPREKCKEEEINLNGIAKVKVKLSQAIYLDKYQDNKANGAFILVDLQTNNTSAVGFLD